MLTEAHKADLKVYFSIPLQPKSDGINWERVNELLKHTLRSIEGQSNSNFVAIVCGHEYPEVLNDFSKDKFIFLHADFAKPDSREKGRADKGKKRLRIANEIHRLGGGYMMYLDADDLVHKNLVEYILSDNNGRGYIISDGYALDYNNNVLGAIPGVWRKEYHGVCGSSGIVYFSQEDLPADAKTRNKLIPIEEQILYYRIKNHTHFEKLVFSNGKGLDKIPFSAGVYVINNFTNLSYNLVRDAKRQKELVDAVRKWRIANQEDVLKDFSFFTS